MFLPFSLSDVVCVDLNGCHGDSLVLQCDQNEAINIISDFYAGYRRGNKKAKRCQYRWDYVTSTPYVIRHSCFASHDYAAYIPWDLITLLMLRMDGDGGHESINIFLFYLIRTWLPSVTKTKYSQTHNYSLTTAYHLWRHHLNNVVDTLMHSMNRYVTCFLLLDNVWLIW